MAVSVQSTVLAPNSPEWWVHRLWIQLTARNQMVNFYEDYYTGQHPLPWLNDEADEEFREILHMARSNYCGLVVDAQVERMMVDGFRVGEPSKRTRDKPNLSDGPKDSSAKDKPSPLSGDDETWRIWTANDMDSEFDKALLESAIAGMSYVSLAPNAEDPSTPHMYVEHPTQCIIEYVPGSNRRKTAAALKIWDDDWTSTVYAVLYLLEDGKVNVYKFKQKRGQTAVPNIDFSDLERKIKLEQLVQPQWTEREVPGEQWGGSADLDEIPFYEIPNNPRMLTGGRSELEDITDVQDRVNKTLADRLVTQDYGAFPQKWVSGWPTTDANGNKNPEIETGRNRIVTTEVVETEFGQWQAAPLDPYSAAKREDVKDIASRTRTPAQYLLGEMSNVNGQTLKASESGLVAKVRQRMRNIDDPLERFVAHARRMAGLSTPVGQTVETIWRNPEHRTEGELVDALTKMATLGVPQEALWERWGATPPERERWKQMQDDAIERSMNMDPLTGMLAHRYRLLAGSNPKASAAQMGGGGAPGQPPKPGQPLQPGAQPKSATNNFGRPPGTPGLPGQAGRPGKNGRPRGSTKTAGAPANA
jgi:hypothetical protein